MLERRGVESTQTLREEPHGRFTHQAGHAFTGLGLPMLPASTVHEQRSFFTSRSFVLQAFDAANLENRAVDSSLLGGIRRTQSGAFSTPEWQRRAGF